MTTSESTENSTGRRAATAAAGTFSAEERAAMQDRAAELKASARRGKATREDGERDLLAKIEGLDEPERTMAERIHAIVTAELPDLWPQTYYGMPAWGRNGKAVLFFKPGPKYRMRYSTLGFTDAAHLDEGDMWAAEFALVHWSDDVAARVAALVKRAAA